MSPAAPSRDQVAGAIAAVVVASWLPVLVGATTRAAFGWAAAVVLAIVVERLTRRFTPAVLVSGMVVSSALVASGLVTDPTHYMPVAVTGGALTLRAFLETWHTRRLIRIAPRAVLVTLGLYLAWAALATVTSTNRGVSIAYLAGMVGVCALAFWVAPAMLSKRSDREHLLAAVGVLGVLVAISVYVVAVVGAINVFGRAIGDVQLADLTIGGRATGFLFWRPSGIYLAPLEAAVTMAIAISCLLGWSITRTGRALLASRLGIAFMVPAILLTLDRTGWLAIIVAAGAFAVLARAARLHAATAAIVCFVFAAVFLAVLVGGVGVNAVGSTCTVNCAAASGGDETTLRGGTGLSGREYLWKASVYAIEKKPILGFGPGNDVPALVPYLGGGGQHIQTLTSHSTWLRTAVEMGVPALVFLLTVLAAVGWTFLRWLRTSGNLADPAHLAVAATVFGLLPAATFESFLLGGVTFTSMFLAVGLGLVAVPLRPAGASAPAAGPVRA